MAVIETISVERNDLMVGLVGHRDKYLKLVEDAFACSVHARGNEITIDGGSNVEAKEVLQELLLILDQGQNLEPSTVRRAIQMVQANERPSVVLTDRILSTFKGKPVRTKTAGQKKYVDAIRRHTITFGVGPAGTGKSWLAVACAVAALQNKEVDRILLTRPAVEAGESLGYLPGDLMTKVDPYLRPLYDALNDMVGSEGLSKLFERDAVEVAPLAFMLGRTLNDSFIILDEAQNTTPQQMKMFLTRIGFNAKVVVTGDQTQTDVPGSRSGLAGLDRILGDIAGVSFVNLGAQDVVRHKIVQDIVDAYSQHE